VSGRIGVDVLAVEHDPAAERQHTWACGCGALDHDVEMELRRRRRCRQCGVPASCVAVAPTTWFDADGKVAGLLIRP
jgi:hypothetical protein